MPWYTAHDKTNPFLKGRPETMNKIAPISAALPLTPTDAALASPRTTPGMSIDSDDVPVLKAWIRCAVCAIEVPLDEALVPEPTDRLIHLCGLDCYARWRAAAAVSFPLLSPKPD
jgi:Domain of unknown function (DUF3330)